MKIKQAIKILSRFHPNDQLYINDDDGTFSEATAAELIPISRQESVIGGDYRYDKNGAYTVIFVNNRRNIQA